MEVMDEIGFPCVVNFTSVQILFFRKFPKLLKWYES